MRRQLPVHSPLPVRALVEAVSGGARSARRRLAEVLAGRLGVPPDGIVLTASGTDALSLGLEAVVRSAGGGSIAIPAYTCWDVGTALQVVGREARFFDLDPASLAPDLDSVETALSDGAVALVVSPLFGYPVPWSRLRELADRYDAVLVEDSAQSHGSRWSDGAPGTVGDLSILSFGRGKGWTGGGGGCLVVRTKELGPCPRLPVATSLASTVRWLVGAAGQAFFGRPSVYGLPSGLPPLRLGESVYHPPARPRAMLPLQAALAASTETSADAEARTRRERATRLLQRIPATPRVRPVAPANGGEPGFLRLPVLVDHPCPRWIREARRLGVVRAYPSILPDVGNLDSIRGPTSPPLPGARLLAERLFTVPTHSLLREHDLARIVASLTRV